MLHHSALIATITRSNFNKRNFTFTTLTFFSRLWTSIYVLPDDLVIIAFGIKFKLQDSAGGILLGIRDEGYAFLTEEAVAQIARRAETTESFSELIRTLGK